MNFELYGPFELKAEFDAEGFSGWIDQSEINEFWVEVKKQHEDLERACGVYMFCVEGKQKGKGKITNLPWYVGKAEKLTFKQECFNHRNQLSYNKVISQLYREVTAINFYFVARHDEDGKFSAPANKDEKTPYEGVRFAERLFMQKSLAANNHLLNKMDLTNARRTHIRNILNWPVKGRDDYSAAALKDSLGINDHVSLLENVSSQKSEKSKNLSFYPVYGPYDFPTYKSTTRTVDDEFISAFWDQFASDVANIPDFPNATGVYVIGVRHGNNITPHYIGTSAGSSFHRVLDKSQIQDIVKKRGAPVAFFLPRVSGKSNQKVEKIKTTYWIPQNMEFVEKWLLGYGIVRNPEITTGEEKIADIMRELHIEGFIRPKPGKPRKPVRQLRELLGE
ncbi:MAG: hypothetical protein OXG29_06795 [Gammaproteobacteria bacterium]|nr:hypothetical protein [Gammaproteobacteria bacterium]